MAEPRCFKMEQGNDICAFPGCTRHVRDGVADYHVVGFGWTRMCCSVKHEAVMRTRASKENCLMCGRSRDETNSVIGWWCGDPECKKQITEKMYVNWCILAYTRLRGAIVNDSC